MVVLLLVILGVIFLTAGGYLFQVWEDYHEASAGYQKLQKFIIEKPNVEKGFTGQPGNREEQEENLPEIDFDGLRAINGDIVAWIQIPGIGVDYRNRADFTDSKVILYGHNMKDGSMFSNLKKFQDADFRKEQGRVVIFLPDRVLEYEIVEYQQVSVNDAIYKIEGEEEAGIVSKRIILSICSSSAGRRMILECDVLSYRSIRKELSVENSFHLSKI